MKSLKTKIRVGKISYTNTVPFYHGLSGGAEAGCEFYESFPTGVNQAMREGRIDIAPISSLEYLQRQKKYLLLPDLAIGARDFSGSVLLVSKERIEGLHKTKIALTHQSLSAAALLQILLRLKYKFANEFAIYQGPPEKALENHTAALVIGDEAFFFEPKEFCYKYDLSELWWNWTEKPFCFALWAVRREFAEDCPEEVSAFHKRLKKNLEKNLLDIETLIKEALELTFLDRQFSKVFGYLFNLNYHLDAALLEGLELFYRLAARLELAPRASKIEFFEGKKVK